MAGNVLNNCSYRGCECNVASSGDVQDNNCAILLVMQISNGKALLYAYFSALELLNFEIIFNG